MSSFMTLMLPTAAPSSSCCRRLAAIVGSMTYFMLSASCERRPTVGHLKVVAPLAEGSFDVYRIASEAPLQLVSEEEGHFNEDIPLAPGSYLVLADCSSETIIIYPNQHAVLVAHRVAFAPPRKPDDKDSFSIQCSRSDQTKSRQLISGRYELNILNGKRDLLVGMVPLQIDLSPLPDSNQPRMLTYQLSGLQVEDFPGNRQEVDYFISPADEMIAATKYQQFGHWEFLLAGRYQIEVNGTQMEVILKEGEQRLIKPALLRVSTSSEVDLDLPARIKGSPWLVEINGDHWLSFNETYPALPGDATISISGSTQSVDIELIEGETTELQARSVMVESSCTKVRPGEPNFCLGEKGVSLYVPEEPYPFIESVSDIPILFIDEGTPVLVGIEGSRDIVYQVPSILRDKTLAVGYVKMIPIPQHRPGQITDLVRVDSTSAPVSGHSLDLNLEHSTLMPLFAGSYRLDQFLSITMGDTSTRQNLSRAFNIEVGKTIEMEFPVSWSEKKFAMLKKKHPHGDEGKTGELGTYKHARRMRML